MTRIKAKIEVDIADHHVVFETQSEWIAAYIRDKFAELAVEASGAEADLYIAVEDGYGEAFVDYDVAAERDGERVIYTRTDYRIELDSSYRTAQVGVYDDFALKHALVNVFSAFLTHREWGLLVHSSCMLQSGRSYLFAGHSGAGKSTVAQLSYPRPILSDEATLLRITEEGVQVYTSPFRSDTRMPELKGPYPLAAVQFLRQSPENRRVPVSKVEGVVGLMNRVFYWAHDPEETRKVLRLCRKLIEHVPAYDLHFQKNDTFWEEIS
ncbi:hypothetical protein SAMN02799630_02456 [Paenibacillus sp. UNCCL117]|uniref:hypothetical protein n=1 Tax=unclassified Paenibacillus TaxID=185978 RepID=UPI00087FABE4|nr:MULTISPECIES: hypothetical protein [unclassified Paenibacillus]SDC02275.1 hypothetical protein SAMN04488602_101124 [Paenibacillus sp. cl123]SFW36816.1 hypothetical protein SAMN02799630_02456 [Paenibacillus sp. UNCCL117]